MAESRRRRCGEIFSCGCLEEFAAASVERSDLEDFLC